MLWKRGVEEINELHVKTQISVNQLLGNFLELELKGIIVQNQARCYRIREDLVIQKEKASDLVMPSKLTTILAVGGHALVTANKTSSLYQLLKTFKMGQLVTAEDPTALAEGILKAYESQNNENIKVSARAYAEKHLEINNVMSSFVGNL